MPKVEWLKLAILYDKTATYTPSNDSAIDAFCESAIRAHIYPSVIQISDIDLLGEFDYLFIRTNTHPGNETFGFALEAERLGKKVIDNSTSIMQGCNKIWQWEQFRNNKIPHPKTWLDKYAEDRVYWPEEIIFPCVIKLHDSCFSQGVFKCDDIDEYKSTLYELKSLTSSSLLCQEFMKTKFDWRITIFNNQFLFAIKYYMVKGDWKIIKYDRNGKYTDGKHECVVQDKVPSHILAAAAKCNKFLTNGLYGIDIKEVENSAYVIEINDNASIDAGVEDGIEGVKIYDTIMKWYR